MRRSPRTNKECWSHVTRSWRSSRLSAAPCNERWLTDGAATTKQAVVNAINLLKRNFILLFAPKMYFLLVPSPEECTSVLQGICRRVIYALYPPQGAPAGCGEDTPEGWDLHRLPPRIMYFGSLSSSIYRGTSPYALRDLDRGACRRLVEKRSICGEVDLDRHTE